MLCKIGLWRWPASISLLVGRCEVLVRDRVCASFSTALEEAVWWQVEREGGTLMQFVGTRCLRRVEAVVSCDREAAVFAVTVMDLKKALCGWVGGSEREGR